MRARAWLTSAALGAALLTGSTVATAQAAPASATAMTDIGTFSTRSACQSFGRAGVYSVWACRPSTTTSNWHLWVDLNS
jgi:hypothetical protein